MREFFTSGTVVSVTDLLFAMIFIAVLFMIAGPLAFIPLFILPVMMVVGFMLQWPLERAMRKLQAEAAARHGVLVDATPERTGGQTRWLYGPWPLAAGAIGLAAVNVATLLIAGRPWGITGAFGLWGAKLLQVIGVPVSTWPYWSRWSSISTRTGYT